MLEQSYAACRRVNAAYGRTYYLATRLLPRERRPAVHALYAFARVTDEIVDDGRPGAAERLAEWTAAFRDRRQLAGAEGAVLPAVWHTLDRWRLPDAYVDAFLASMAMDLTTTGYATYAELAAYMYGSAEVIGLLMLPVLGHPGVPHDVVAPPARALGAAFQLTNFIRDVREDLARGRVYLPQEDLDRFGVTRSQLAARDVDDRFRALLAFEVARARDLYDVAATGIPLLDARSRDCVRTAFTLYGGILDAVERADYRVLDRRVRLGRTRRVTVAAPALIRAARSRRGTAARPRAVPTTPTVPA